MHEDVFPAPTGSASASDSAPANQLAQAASSYLRSALHQPVAWHCWGEAAFARARAEDKPILLDIGAVWCHWCHVMDRESYENPAIAAIINRHFVAVKVDRDERPDVDARYQAAIAAISGQGGWPLTGFLTPDGRPYYGGTYFPPEDGHGRPGFGRVLTAMAQVWRERRDEALKAATDAIAAIEHNESFSSRGGELSAALPGKLVAAMCTQFDARNGGFGTQPKFPHPAALDLLLQAAMNRGNEEAGLVFSTTLEKMARGGVYDQLAGGFHRYSVDERWHVPHFEKMLYDNTELLRNYLHGFQSYQRGDFLVTAREIADWLETTMSDRTRGGFYASQDADINLDDDGDYFTWTQEEARDALNAAGFVSQDTELALRYWEIGAYGDMHHNPAKNVLRVETTPEALGAGSGQSAEAVRFAVEQARHALLAARNQRPTPFIDRTLYTGWNAMAVTAFLDAARLAGMEGKREFALRTLDRLLGEAWDGQQTLRHVIAYGEAPDGTAPTAVAPGTLDDYAFTIHAVLDAWFASGTMRYYRAAVQLAEAMIARFYDPTGCAFCDTAAPAAGATPLGALSARRKPLQDTPTPAGNPTAAAALLRLAALSGRREFHEIAEDTLASFSGIAGHYGLHAGSYGLAVERLLLDPVQVGIVGSGPAAERMEALALGRFGVQKSVIRIRPEQLAPEGIPEGLAEYLLAVPQPEGAEAWALICRGRTCLPPITTAWELTQALEESTGNFR